MGAKPCWNIDRAKARMVKVGLTQADLARRLRYTRPALSHWLSGRTVPLIPDLHRLATTLEMSVAELLADDDLEVGMSEAQRDVVRLMKSASIADQQMVLAIVEAAVRSRQATSPD